MDKKLKIAGVVPVRYHSNRLPGKALLRILGKPILQWVLEAVSQSKEVKNWFVATDSDLISKQVKKMGYFVIRTSTRPVSGTQRVWEAIKNKEIDLVVNVQADEPLISGKHLDRLIRVFKKNKSIKMASLAHSASFEDLKNFNRVKVLLNNSKQAIYFSRFPIPFSKSLGSQGTRFKKKKDLSWALDSGSFIRQDFCLTHVGVYAYRREALKYYASKKPSQLEREESLEQLRALYLGIPIQILKISERTLSVDTEEDMKRVEKRLAQRRKKIKEKHKQN